MSPLLVTHCICHDRSLKEIKEFAEKEGFTEVGELQAAEFCSTNCKMCKPYVELMLETGETAFEPGAYLKVVTKE